MKRFLATISIAITFSVMFSSTSFADTKYVGNGSCHDISGVWDAIYNNYGLPKVKDRVTIVVEGSEFYGTKKIGSTGVDAGQRTIEGRIQTGSLSEVVFLSGRGGAGNRKEPLKEIVIENSCNNIRFYGKTGKVTFTRDAPPPKTKVKKSSATNESDKKKGASETKSSSKTQSIKAKLKGLKELLDEGLITEEEAAQKRVEILKNY